MPLLAYNQTNTPLILAGIYSPQVVLPASPQTNLRGPAFNVTSKLRGKALAIYTLLQGQVAEGKVAFAWTSKPEYDTPGLSVESPDEKKAPSIAPPESPVEYPIIVRTAILDEPAEGEQGLDRAIEIFSSLEYPLRVLLVTGAISRGAPGAQVYLCCHNDGNHEPHSDRFDASQPAMLQEVAMLHDRVIEAGEELFVFCTSDYVRGYVTIMMQRAA